MSLAPIQHRCRSISNQCISNDNQNYIQTTACDSNTTSNTSETMMVEFSQYEPGRQFPLSSGIESYNYKSSQILIYRSKIIPNQIRKSIFREESSVDYFNHFFSESHRLSFSCKNLLVSNLDNCKFICYESDLQEVVDGEDGKLYSNSSHLLIVKQNNLYVFDKQFFNNRQILLLEDVTINWTNYQYRYFNTVDEFKLFESEQLLNDVNYKKLLDDIRQILNNVSPDQSNSFKECILKPFRSEEELINYKDLLLSHTNKITPLFIFNDRKMDSLELQVLESYLNQFTSCESIKLEIPIEYLTQDNGEYLIKLFLFIEFFFDDKFFVIHNSSLFSNFLNISFIDGETIVGQVDVQNILKQQNLIKGVNASHIINVLNFNMQSKPLINDNTRKDLLNLTNIYQSKKLDRRRTYFNQFVNVSTDPRTVNLKSKIDYSVDIIKTYNQLNRNKLNIEKIQKKIDELDNKKSIKLKEDRICDQEIFYEIRNKRSEIQSITLNNEGLTKKIDLLKNERSLCLIQFFMLKFFYQTKIKPDRNFIYLENDDVEKNYQIELLELLNRVYDLT